ncbi:MAG: glycosyltransferase family 25 protein [Zhongshania sp.]|uniref:glycosyltransferase family 25 protein n=1 Tax=Zhongshania sp. TaxID=1971902 RepID=UPI002615770B|nr:glycosyltransferase family 25 protein [Zhongshania sp.]MDF1693804.1 glycosyltransferase family 25 protein [Zhongshania sp.]
MPKKCICWVISLNPASENAQKLMADLNGQGIDAEIFPAIDGRVGTPALEGGEQILGNLAMVRHGKHLTASELGCYLSHLRAVKAAYRNGHEYVCVIEDDVVIENLFGDVYRAVLDKDLDMVRLMSLRIRKRTIIEPLVGEHNLVRPERGGLGTQAYVLNRVGMKKFIDYAQNIYEPVDKVFDHFFLFDLNVFAVEPHVAYELVHETSVVKLAKTVVDKPLLWHRLVFHPVKLWFSLRRHFYRFRHWRDFSQSAMPEHKVGRTERAR